MKSKVFPARYDGVCASTRTAFKAGELIYMEGGRAHIAAKKVTVTDQQLAPQKTVLTWETDNLYDLWYCDNEYFDGERRACAEDYLYFCKHVREEYAKKVRKAGGIMAMARHIGVEGFFQSKGQLAW